MVDFLLVAKPELEIVDYEDQIQIKRQLAKLLRQVQSLTVQLHSCILQPFSDFIERRLWSLAFFLFGNACCIQLGELFAMNVEL